MASSACQLTEAYSKKGTISHAQIERLRPRLTEGEEAALQLSTAPVYQAAAAEEEAQQKAVLS